MQGAGNTLLDLPAGVLTVWIHPCLIRPSFNTPMATLLSDADSPVKGSSASPHTSEVEGSSPTSVPYVPPSVVQVPFCSSADWGASVAHDALLRACMCPAMGAGCSPAEWYLQWALTTLTPTKIRDWKTNDRAPSHL